MSQSVKKEYKQIFADVEKLCDDSEKLGLSIIVSLQAPSKTEGRKDTIFAMRGESTDICAMLKLLFTDAQQVMIDFIANHFCDSVKELPDSVAKALKKDALNKLPL